MSSVHSRHHIRPFPSDSDSHEIGPILSDAATPSQGLAGNLLERPPGFAMGLDVGHFVLFHFPPAKSLLESLFRNGLAA
jgi:hypothetical protein